MSIDLAIILSVEPTSRFLTANEATEIVLTLLDWTSARS